MELPLPQRELSVSSEAANNTEMFQHAGKRASSTPIPPKLPRRPANPHSRNTSEGLRAAVRNFGYPFRGSQEKSPFRSLRPAVNISFTTSISR
jgi:hypothetical protein